MYLPSQFGEHRTDVLEAFIRAHPLGLLVTMVDGRSGVDAIPMLIEATEETGTRLRGHVARANPVATQVPSGTDVLVVFGGAQHYVTPSWYPTKHVDGRVVPTWNYSLVQVRGRIRWFDDARELRSLVDRLTAAHEAPRATPWAVADAPDDYIAGMLRAIVGFDIDVESIVGKFKGSQNRAEADRGGVLRGLEADGVPAEALEELVRRPRA